MVRAVSRSGARGAGVAGVSCVVCLGRGRAWSDPMPAAAFLDALRGSLDLDPANTPIGELVDDEDVTSGGARSPRASPLSEVAPAPTT